MATYGWPNCWTQGDNHEGYFAAHEPGEQWATPEYVAELYVTPLNALALILTPIGLMSVAKTRMGCTTSTPGLLYILTLSRTISSSFQRQCLDWTGLQSW